MYLTLGVGADENSFLERFRCQLVRRPTVDNAFGDVTWGIPTESIVSEKDS